MTTRIPLIAGNWKLFKTGPESIETSKKLSELVTDVENVDIVIAPTFTSLTVVSEVIKNSKIGLAAQNVYWENEGAFTGEVSAQMLLAAGCLYVIIGHSERRQYFHETDDTVNKKISAALSSGLIPILCIGETESEREDEKTFSVLDNQIKNGLEGLSLDQNQSIVIAYEPVWAIGTGKTASPEQVQDVHFYLRNLLEKNFGNIVANATRILYGGSVKPDNVSELMALEDVDGALVGGASLDPEIFNKIIHY